MNEGDGESDFNLIVGFSSIDARSSAALLDDLRRFRAGCQLAEVVFCGDMAGDGLVEPRISALRSAGVEVRHVSDSEIERSASRGRLGKYYRNHSNQKGISFYRTALHYYLYLESFRHPKPVVWILDDDVRLEGSWFVRDTRSRIPFVDLILRLTSNGADVAVGRIHGDPPIPAASMVRTQLLDFDFSLRALRNPHYRPDLDEARRRRTADIAKYPDFYYDLTLSHGGHLETPWYFTGSGKWSTRRRILGEMLERFPEVTRGVSLFRELPESHADAQDIGPTLVRGGNTLVFDISSLRDYPNISPQAGGVAFRRGDTLWTVLNRRSIKGEERRKVVPMALSVRQERWRDEGSRFDTDALLADILGGAFTRAVDEILTRRQEGLRKRGSNNSSLHFSDSEITEALQIYHSRLKERLDLLELNSWRIIGLVGSIRTQLREATKHDTRISRLIGEHSARIEELLSTIERSFCPPAISKLKERAIAHPEELEAFLRNLEDYCNSYRGQLLAWNGPLEEAKVASYLNKRLGGRKVALLSRGGEGLIFTDGKRVFKYFYYGLNNFDPGQLELIRKSCAIGNLEWSMHINPIEEIITDGLSVTFVSPMVTGHDYRGGHLNQLLGLLRECKRAGIVLTNISPKNLVVTDSTLKYVDLGRSVEAFEAKTFEVMCRKAYLVYKWHFRSDLKELLTRALVDQSIPELLGFEHFWAALDEKDVHEVEDGALLAAIASEGPKSVLDYGCGNGRVADELARRGVHVTAFDIDRSKYAEHRHPRGAEFVDQRQLDVLMESGARFDIVLCNLVLCSIGDDSVPGVLSNLRRLVRPQGAVIVGLCNPFSLEIDESECQKLDVPVGKTYGDHFSYAKLPKTTNGRRTDFHRPYSWYQMAFRRAGFRIDDIGEVEGTDVSRLCPGSDFILLRLKPEPLAEPLSVSLLIKASAMEWMTIREQVEHIVGQLEGPRFFLERVVVVDTYVGPFARQYDSGNFEAVEKSLHSLVARGIIDRILVAPNESTDEAASIMRKWFSITEPVARAFNGQPTLTTLYGIENCRGNYVFHVDADCLIGRQDRRHDYLADILGIFDSDPNCVTVSFPIASRRRSGYAPRSEHGKWRTEVRCGIISKQRLEEILPLPNRILDGALLARPWHRALDLKLKESDSESYRGADPREFFIHVPNAFKRDFNSWYNVMKAVEEGRLYEGQIGHVDLVGKVEDWLPRRSESCVLLVRGKGTPISRVRRCFRSLVRQSNQDWGLVVIDAASTNGADEYVAEIIQREFKDRMTFYRNLMPQPPIENIDFAIRKLCRNSRSIIVMVDEDDALISADAITYVKSFYSQGADLAIGGILRTDKEVQYQADFRDPRHSRGGNVWQHLRTFRKYLFDRIDPEDLKVDDEWVPHTEDWAFMLPMAEMARSPVQFQKTLYLYEPSPQKQDLPKAERERIIAKIVSKRPYEEATG